MTTKTVSAAIVTIHDAENMTPKGRKQVAAWLRRQAKFLETHGDQLDKLFRARYLYEFDPALAGPRPKKVPR